MGRWRRIAVASGAVCCALNVPYAAMVFVRTSPEFRHTGPKVLPSIYFSTPERAPGGAYFGFPHRSGWKGVAELVTRGVFGGSYDSNEEELITRWYLRGMPRTAESPDFYFLADAPNDAVELRVPRSAIEKTYHFWGRVYSGARRRIDVYGRAEPPSGRPIPWRFDGAIVERERR
jgi:hypothetical protein